jgi:hypothetical protein
MSPHRDVSSYLTFSPLSRRWRDRTRSPVCRFRRGRGGSSPSPGPALPLMGWTGIRRLVCRPQCRSLVPCPTRPRPVSVPGRVLHDRPSAGIVRPQVHPSLTDLPFRVPSHLSPARCLSAPGSLLGFLALPRRHRSASTHARRSRPRYVPSSGFLGPSTACSALRLGGLFHPPAMSRTIPVQGLLPPRSHSPSSGGGAPLPLCTAALAAPEGPAATPRRLGFEALLHAEMRGTDAGIGRSDARSPPQVPLSSRCSLPSP